VSRLYGARQRAFQDRFDTRRIADRIEELAVHAEIGDMDKAFIESRDMFWLSTVDEQAPHRPTRAATRLREGGRQPTSPSRSMTATACSTHGNVAGNGKVGLLFMDFEHPNRLRVQGAASVSERDPLIEAFHEAILVVRVTVSELFPNCPRYVHRMQKMKASRYVPRPQCPAPIAGWKRIDILQEDLPAGDRARAQSEGMRPISIEEWFGKVAEGSEEA
jgi:predicted pyridoxine 5'-phosphate oxidase superfamily flavin-nucleotide-binding protein